MHQIVGISRASKFENLAWMHVFTNKIKVLLKWQP